MKACLLFLLCSTCFAAKFKIRAREHFESHKIKTDDFTTTYTGLNNTINLWWEDPYKLSYGFAISPVISGLTPKDDDDLGDRIILPMIGFEVKYFPWEQFKKFYVRPGLGYIELRPDNSYQDHYGYYGYLGVGLEIPYNMFGLALEVAYRKSYFNDDVEMDSLTPSIGFHFYKSL